MRKYEEKKKTNNNNGQLTNNKHLENQNFFNLSLKINFMIDYA